MSCSHPNAWRVAVKAWTACRSREAAARAVWRRVLNTSYWAAFGYIAAEAELFEATEARRGGELRFILVMRDPLMRSYSEWSMFALS